MEGGGGDETHVRFAHGVRRFGAGGLDAQRACGVGRTRFTRGVPRSGESAYRARDVAYGVRRVGAGGLDAGRARGVDRTRFTWGIPRSGEGCACRARL